MKEIPTGVDKLGYSLAIHGWLLILSSNREPIIISPCGQDVCFPVGFTNNCLEDNVRLSQSEDLVQYK